MKSKDDFKATKQSLSLFDVVDVDVVGVDKKSLINEHILVCIYNCCVSCSLDKLALKKLGGLIYMYSL